MPEEFKDKLAVNLCVGESGVYHCTSTGADCWCSLPLVLVLAVVRCRAQEVIHIAARLLPLIPKLSLTQCSQHVQAPSSGGCVGAAAGVAM